jgi:hypothetical protein
MAWALAYLELWLLLIITLVLALVPTPIPRAWALVSGALVIAETVAVRAMRIRPCGEECGVEEPEGVVNTFAETVGVLVVPALTAVLLTVMFFYLARSYAAARRRLRVAMARAEQRVGGPVR